MLVMVIKIDKKGEIFTFEKTEELRGMSPGKNRQSQWSVDYICQVISEHISYSLQASRKIKSSMRVHAVISIKATCHTHH